MGTLLEKQIRKKYPEDNLYISSIRMFCKHLNSSQSYQLRRNAVLTELENLNDLDATFADEDYEVEETTDGKKVNNINNNSNNYSNKSLALLGNTFTFEVVLLRNLAH